MGVDGSHQGSLPQSFPEARRFLASGRAGDAERALKKALAAGGDSADALQLLGVAVFQRGRSQEAVRHIRRALELEPTHLEALVNLGTVLQKSDDIEGALDAFSRAADAHPGSAEAWNYKGLCLQLLDRQNDALLCFDLALGAGPGFAEALFNRANTYRSKGEMDGAIKDLRAAIESAPRFAEAFNNLGGLLMDVGKIAEAEAAYRRAVELAPGFAAFQFNRGTALEALGETGKARECFRGALKVRPGYVDAAVALAQSLRDDGRAPEALAILSHPSIARSGDEIALVERARLLLELGEVDEARSSLEPFPELSAARAVRALSLPVVARSRQEIDEARARVLKEVRELREGGLKLRDPMEQMGLTNFYLAYHRWNEIDLQREIAAMYLEATPELGWTAPHCERPPRPSGRIRLAVVSSFLLNHTIGKLFAPLIERLDRDRFELVFCRLSTRTDEVSQRIADRAHKTISVSLNLPLARLQIAATEPDVVFFPEIGMNPQTYYLAFSRLAPLQFMTWGHPATTAIPNMDAFVSTEAMEPAGSEAGYTERLARLPDLTTFYIRPEPPAPEIDRSKLGLPEDARLYVCPQTLFKLHPDLDEAFAEIVRRDPHAVIVLIEGRYPKWREILEERYRNLEPRLAERVVFSRRLSREEYLALMKLADVVLDPFYFSGGNSSIEGFSVGAPIVTWPTELLRARITHACYEKMGISDLEADGPESYVGLALRVAQDRDFRMEVSRRILEASERLFENADAVRQLEDWMEAEFRALPR